MPEIQRDTEGDPFFFGYRFVLFILKAQLQRDKDDGETQSILPLASSVPQRLQQSGLDWDETRNQELASSGSRMWVPGHKHLGHPLLLSQSR